MAGKMVVIERTPGDTFSVGDAVQHFRYDKEVKICAGRGPVQMVSSFFFNATINPKICKALDDLAKAMLEEGAEEAEIVVIG